MAKFIAHRGNIDGPNYINENRIEYLEHTFSLGHDVECDLFGFKDKLYLGHDGPMEVANNDFLVQEGVWCHAKNIEALHLLMKIGANCFWHQSDTVTLTSKGFIWCYPGHHPQYSNAVWLDLENKPLPDDVSGIHGICGDYVIDDRI